MTSNILTQARLKEQLHYDPETGIFTWLVSSSPRVKIGDISGSLNGEGYLINQVNGRMYVTHRLAFLYMTGDIPEQVDHENHIRHDNRWANLRAATNKINQQNASIRKDNKSGFTGVNWHKSIEKWVAYINVDNVRIHLGCFSDVNDAIAARKSANIKYGFHPNHGH